MSRATARARTQPAPAPAVVAGASPLACLVLLAVLALPCPAHAALQVLSSPRVRVTADLEQQGPREGFLTLRVHCENQTGRAQRVRLHFDSRPSTSVDASVDLAGAERRTLDLLVPAAARYGQLSADDGRERGQESFTWHWLSHDPLLLEEPTAGADLVARGKSSDGSPTTYAAAVAVPREQLPTTLAGLVGYAAVGVLETPFEELPEPQRRALEAYAAVGGELYLAQIPARPETTLPLWRGPRSEGAHAYGLGRVHLHPSAARCADALRLAADLQRAGTPLDASTRYPYGSFGGAPSDPLIDVARVPVGGFLLLVLAFVLVIGPGSFVVRARKGPGALVLFIPLTALATCGGITGYGVLHEGLFTIHASSRVVTVLDAEHHRAVSQAVDGYYASLAPAAVRFAALSTPIPPQGAVGDSLDLDLTSGLTIRGGYVPSRSYREHLTVTVAPARARLSVRPGGSQGGDPRVENALGAKVIDGVIKLDGRNCLFHELGDGASGPVACGQDAAMPEVERRRFEEGLKGRFNIDRLALNVLAPLEEGEFLVSLDRAAFAPDLGFSVQRTGDFQLVRGRVSP